MRVNVSLLQSRDEGELLYRYGHELLMRVNVSLLQSRGQGNCCTDMCMSC